MAPFDPYAVLEVDRSADPVAIRRAYQKLARRYHPHYAPGEAIARQRFREVERAYRILGDPERRRRFDAGEPPGSRTGRRERLVATGYLEIFAARGARPEGAVGRDLAAETTITFAEAVRGTVASLSVQREKPCETCRGEPSAGAGPRCERCAGRGVLVDLERVRVRLPSGVEDGAVLRFAGRGQAGRGSEAGSSGDLLLTVRVRPHPYFRREGLDVHAELPVTLAEAVLGAEVEVPTIDGPVRVRLPAGTSGGQRFRLRGRGVRRPDGTAGDHHYRVRIVLPRTPGADLKRVCEGMPPEAPRAGLPDEPV